MGFIRSLQVLESDKFNVYTVVIKILVNTAAIKLFIIIISNNKNLQNWASVLHKNLLLVSNLIYDK